MNRVVQNIFPILLVLTVIFLGIVNYTPGTYLTGWDTLQPEFNFSLYFQRIMSVWQEHQGLGAPASQSHSAEIPRLLVYYPLSIILPGSFLRYFYFFSTLIVGVLGAYYFFKHFIFKYVEEKIAKVISFCGAMYYLLNLATLQQYYVPLEMFAHHFATLPWVFYATTKYLEKGGLRNFSLVCLLAFFVAPIAHTATLFYVFITFMVLYWTIFSLFFSKNIKRLMLVILSFFVLNGYWLLPNFYYISTMGKSVSEAHINTQFSEKAFLTGQKFGDIENALILKNFLFDWGEYDEKSGKFIDLFDEWESHLSGFGAFLIERILLLLVILGVSATLIKNRNNGYLISIFPLGLISFFVIANQNAFSEYVFNLIKGELPVLKEALRFPFTKFSIIIAFAYSIYISVFLYYIFAFFKKYLLAKSYTHYIFAIIFSGLLVFHFLPAFQGNLISDSLKQEIPNEYFEVFEWFDNQEKFRVAVFPIDTFWGWTYHDWGFEGAGFRWFGIKQPLLEREFDRWNPYNENYYHEASYAVYSKNFTLLESVFDKYQVRWLLVDESVVNPWSGKSLYFDELDEYISKSNKISLVKSAGKLKIYEIKIAPRPTNHIILAANLSTVGTSYKWSNFDQAYLDKGGYIFSGINPNRIYPFRSIFTLKDPLETDIDENREIISVSKKIIADKSLNLIIPKDIKELVNLRSDYKKSEIISPSVEVGSGEIVVTFPKIKGFYSSNVNLAKELLAKGAKNCNINKGGYVQNRLTKEGENYVLRLVAKDATNCTAGIWLENLPHEYSYIVNFKSRNISGQSILFWVENLNSRRSDQEIFVSKVSDEGEWVETNVIIPPMGRDAVGYALHFDNIGIGKSVAINDLGEVNVYPFPWKYLHGLYFEGLHNELETSYIPVNAKQLTPDLYEVALDSSQKGTLILSQAYNDGWKAYSGHYGYLSPVLGKEIKGHVKVNNWENGWTVPENSEKITIIFIPQYLQFLGYGLIIAGIVLFVKFRGSIKNI